MGNYMVDLLVLNYNDASTTKCFVNNVKNFLSIRKILVVDNKSTDDSLKILKKIESDKVVVVASDKNGGYGYGNNYGIRYLKEHFSSEYILLCNPDVIVEEKVIQKLEIFLKDKLEYAVVAPMMLNARGELQNHTAFKLPTTLEYILSLSFLAKRMGFSIDMGISASQSKSDVIDVGAVTGSLFMLNVKKMMKYGMYDERIFLYCEEVVLGKKLSLNSQKIALLPKLFFIHNHSVSISKTFDSLIKRHTLLVRSKLFVIKQYFNPNHFEMLLTYLFIAISYVEIFSISILKKLLRR